MTGAPESGRATKGGWSRVVGTLFNFATRHPIWTTILLSTLGIIVGIATLPFDDIRNLRTVNPHETAFMREQIQLAAIRGVKLRKVQEWVPLDQIPKTLVDAVVVAEDGTFWSNSGFDWFEFQESFSRDLQRFEFSRGASTITQQLVKNLYLSSSKNPLRKAKEWILTWYAARTLSKSRILELYLNVIEWGNGIYGAQAAARYHFGKNVSDLTRDECARLAAIIPSPRRHRADSDSPYVLRRSRIVIARMDARGRPTPQPDENFFEQDADSFSLVPDTSAIDSSSVKRDSL